HHHLYRCYAAHRVLRSFPPRRSSDLLASQVGSLGEGLAGDPRRARKLNREAESCASVVSIWSTPSRAAMSASCSSAPTCRRTCRSEEHTSELQSRGQLVCRLLLEKKH